MHPSSSNPLTMVLSLSEHLNVHSDHMVHELSQHHGSSSSSHHHSLSHHSQLNPLHHQLSNENHLSHHHLNPHLSLLDNSVHHYRSLHGGDEEEEDYEEEEEGESHHRPMSPPLISQSMDDEISSHLNLPMPGSKGSVGLLHESNLPNTFTTTTTPSLSSSKRRSSSSSGSSKKSKSGSSKNSANANSKKNKKVSKLTSVSKVTKKIVRRKEINQYSQSHQSRIRDTLHKKLIEVAGGEDNIMPLLQNYFFSHEEGKKYFEKLHPPQQELQRYYNLLPVLKRNCNKNNKKLFIRLLRHSCFTKSQSESALGISICNDTWKKAGFLEEPVVEKKRKINDEIARAIVEWMKLNTRPTKKTTQVKNESGEVETVNTHCVDCCFHHLYTKFVAGLESKQIQIMGLETISESSFRKLIPKFIKLPKKKTECQI